MTPTPVNSADKTGITRYRFVISGKQSDSESEGQEMRNRRGAFAATATDATSSLTATGRGAVNSLTQALYVAQENATTVVFADDPAIKPCIYDGTCTAGAPGRCATAPAGSVVALGGHDRIHRRRMAGPGTA
jgi:hypothetical protein